MKRSRLTVRPTLKLLLEADPRGFVRITEQIVTTDGQTVMSRPLTLSSKKAYALGEWLTTHAGSMSKSTDPQGAMIRTSSRGAGGK